MNCPECGAGEHAYGPNGGPCDCCGRVAGLEDRVAAWAATRMARPARRAARRVACEHDEASIADDQLTMTCGECGAVCELDGPDDLLVLA